MGKFLPTAKISSAHGKLFRVNWNNKDLFIIPMYHPAASLRNGEVMRQEKEDFLRLPDALKKIVEEKKKIVPKSEQMGLL